MTAEAEGFELKDYAPNVERHELEAMQQAYDLWHAERRMKDELSEIETVASVGSGT